jgi:hypothetical protein
VASALPTPAAQRKPKTRRLFSLIPPALSGSIKEEPRVDVTDSQGHELRGKFDAAADIVSVAVTFRWGGPRETAPVSGKDMLSYRK